MTDDQTQTPQADETSAQIKGEIERVVYRGDNGYTIAAVLTEDLGKVTLVGMMPPVTEGMRVLVQGEKYWKPERGWQYKVLSFQEDGFTSEDALIKYLSSPSFPDIGKSFARQVVARFGMDTLDVLDNNPEKLKSIPGLSQARASKLIKLWDEQRAVHHLMTELMSYGLTLNMATKVSKMLGANASTILRENPYRLTEIPSIGFVRADEIARRMGVPQNSPFRIAAAIMHVMDRSQLDGDCYKQKADVAAMAQELLQAGVADTKGLGIMDVSNQIGALAQRGALVAQNKRLYLAHLYFAEKFCAEAIQEMMAYGKGKQFYPTIESLEADLDRLDGGLTFAPEQKQALMTALNERVVIITGGPGVGKSTITRALCDLFDKQHISYELCSPTGRAAKRLMEATGRPARTIHRLLKASKEGEFHFNEANPLQTNAVIVDETSMVDVSLFKHLLSAMETDDRLILIGDADQLPSVGAGNVLRDIIRSQAVPTVRLKHIFRQSAGSMIVQAAHGVLNGVVPDLPSPSASNGRNCMLVAAKEVEVLMGYIKTMVGTSLPAAGYAPNDIQVITPMREKGLGIHDLNPVLQQEINPPHPNKPQVIIGSRTFRLGDRVIQLQNDYEKDVFNGDQGFLASVVNNDGSISLGVDFQGKDQPTIYTGSEIDALMHAYAITVHRSQGSEYPAVVLVLHDSQRTMLQRNLFYTAMTRAKRMLVVTGSISSMTMAVNNETAHKRNTALFEWLSAPVSA